MNASASKKPLPIGSPLLLPAGILLAVLWTIIIGWQTVVRFPCHLQAIQNMFFLGRLPSPDLAAVWAHLLDCFKNLAFLAGFVLSAYGLGGMLLEKVFPAVRSRLEEILQSLGLGFACLSLVLFGLGAAGWLKPAPWYGIFYITAACGAIRSWLRRDRLTPGRGWLLGARTWAEVALLVALLPIFVLVLLAVNTPEIFFDSLVYHLAVPAHWVQAGRILPLPYNFFSNFPMGIEMLYSGALLLSDERLCRLLHACLGLGAVLALFCLGRRWLSRRAGLWGAAILCATPLFVINLSEAGVDAAAVFYSLLGLHVFLDALLAGPGPARPEGASGKPVLLAGIFMGAAVACKYNQAFMLAPAVAVTLALARKKGQSFPAAGKIIFTLGLGAMLLILPWWGKNLVFTGNPVYPFLHKLLPNPMIHPEKMQQQMDGFREFSHRTLAQYVRQPWDLTFYYPTGNSYVGTVYLFLLPGLALLAFQSRRGPPVLKIFLGTVLLTALIWSSQTQIARYFLPALPLAALLGAQALEISERWHKALGRFLRWAAAGLMLWGVAVTLNIAAASWDQVPAALGWESRWAYLDRQLMNSYTPMARKINALPEGSKVLFFGETRAFYCERSVTAATVYDYQPLLEWTARLNSAEAVWLRLRQQGYTHVFVHAAEAVRTRGYETYRWQAPAVARWQEVFSRYLKPLAVFGQQRLYAVLPEPWREAPVKTGRPLYTYDPETVASVLQHYQQAVAAVRQNRWYDAQAEWMRVLELAPEWETPYADLGWLYFQMQKPGEGFAMYQKADALGVLDPAACNFLAEQYARLGNTGEAKKYFRLALEQAPELQSARVNLERVEKFETSGGK